MAGTTSLTFRLDNELLAALDAEAARRGITRSDALRILLGRALAPPEEPPSAARTSATPAPRAHPPAPRATPAHGPAQIDADLHARLQRKYRP
jgi:hypothetical protein